MLKYGYQKGDLEDNMGKNDLTKQDSMEYYGNYGKGSYCD